MFNTLIGVLKSAGVSLELIILICILFMLVCICGIVLKAYLDFRLKQKDCDNRFKMVERTAGEAKTDSKEAINAVRDMKPKVDDMHDWFKNLVEGKYENAKKESKTG